MRSLPKYLYQDKQIEEQIDALLQYMHGENDTEMDDTKMDVQNLYHETQQADGELETDNEMDAQTLH